MPLEDVEDSKSKGDDNIERNGNDDSGAAVAFASEDTPLLSASTSEHGSNGEVSLSSTANSVSSIEAVLAEEVAAPWPSTFERSISLLAMVGPQSPAYVREVDLMTRSPLMSATPQMIMARRKVDRLVGSPEFVPKPLVKRHSVGASSAVLSSDALSDKVDLEDKLRIAKAYRQKLLEKQHSTGIQTRVPDGKHGHDRLDSLLYSPGMARESEANRIMKKKGREAASHDHGHGGVGLDGKSSFSQCVFNMANILMGVGMLGLPFVFKSAGWIGGFLVLTSFAAFTWRTSIILGRILNGDPRPGHLFSDSPFKTPIPPGSHHNLARYRKPIHSFPEIARDAYGDRGTVWLSAVLYFELFSCLAIFLVSLGEHMSELFPSISIVNLEIFMAVSLAVPTAVLTTPRLLSYLSAVGTVATIVVVLAVCYTSLTVGDIAEKMDVSGKHGPPYHIEWHTSGLPIALGLVAYCFSGHAIVPSIYTAMKEPQQYERMVTWTFFIVAGCCLAVAVCGYYMFGSSVSDQVTISMANLPSAKTGFAIKMLTWLMVLTAFSKFTLTMFPLALGIEEIFVLWFTTDSFKHAMSSTIRLGLIFAALLVAIFVPSFSFLCSLVGLICTMIVSVIFPAAAHLKLFGEKLSLVEKFFDYVLITFGICSAIVGTVATVS